MAALKNQHFVPRCLFQPFSLNSEGRAINLFNIRRRMTFENVSVSGQCSASYFYGKDLTIEKTLGSLEGNFRAALKRILEGGNEPSDLVTIRFFIYLQSRRTQGAIQKTKEAWEEMHSGIYGDLEAPPLPDMEGFMRESLELCFETRRFIEDLKIRIIENHTGIDFLLCDDPAILTNRYSFQRLKEKSFGLISTGVIFLMPLSPKYAAICYDGAAYSAQLNGLRIHLTKPEDVEAVNEFQLVKAGANVYFSKWSDKDYVAAQFKKYEARRPKSWNEVTFLVSTGKSAEGEHYVPVSPEEARARGNSIVSLGFRYPEPSRWISQLQFRPSIKTYFNGTAIGHVRKEEWLRSRDR